MLINSKFQDYYDSCLGYGIDKKVVFNRETVSFSSVVYENHKRREANGALMEVIKRTCNGWGPDLSPYRDYEWLERFGKRRTGSVCVIGFCGHLTKVFMREEYKDPKWDGVNYHQGGWTVQIWRTTEDIPLAFRDQNLSYMSRLNMGQEFKDPLERDNDEPFIFLDSPYFVAYEDRVISMPNLKSIGFSKIKSGTEAFQEISAYIAGALTSAKQMKVNMTDDIIAASHGFDEKSFRREPTKRKGK